MMKMKLLRLIAALGAVFLCLPAHAQWQTPNHSVPLGIGAGTGFHSAAPGTSGYPLISNGASSDPSFSLLPLGGMASIGASTILGNSTGGSAAPSALSVTTVTGMLNAFVGDSGSGGTKGLVPAPASGDAAANKFLKADGTWTAIGASPPSLNSNNIFTGENQFQNSLSFGPGAPVPATDLHGYAATRPVFVRLDRNQALGIGSQIGRIFGWGQNASSTPGQWGYYAIGVSDCLIKASQAGSGTPTGIACLGNENVAANEEGAHYFYVANGFGSMTPSAKIDNNGVYLYGTGNFISQNGQGVAWPDSKGTLTYGISFNAQHVDLQACNAVTEAAYPGTCGNVNTSIRFLTNAIVPGGLQMEIRGDGTIVMNALGGSAAAGSHAICIDSSNRLFKAPSASAACP